jgi:hypothetical protein
MDESDNGYFTYDDRYPPICVKPPENQLNDYKESMEGAVTSYLQESYKDGLKHEDTILPNGLAVGEAGIFYFRELNHKRRKIEKCSMDVLQIMDRITDSIQKHMGFNIKTSEYQSVFEKHINHKLFKTKQYKRKLLPALKLFLTEINMKTKGYTSKLRNVMSEIDTIVETYIQQTESKTHELSSDS